MDTETNAEIVRLHGVIEDIQKQDLAVLKTLEKKNDSLVRQNTRLLQQISDLQRSDGLDAKRYRFLRNDIGVCSQIVATTNDGTRVFKLAERYFAATHCSASQAFDEYADSLMPKEDS